MRRQRAEFMHGRPPRALSYRFIAAASCLEQLMDLSARYTRAESLLPHNLKKLVLSPQVVPNWIRDTEKFWYRNTTADGHEFLLVDAEAGTKRRAFDHERV